MSRCLWFLFALFASIGPGFQNVDKPRRSQFLRQDLIMQCAAEQAHDPVDLRVEAGTGTALGASFSGAKLSGDARGFTYSLARKRAYRRARARALEHGGTWYRGHWRSAQSLRVQPSPGTARAQARPDHKHPTLQGRAPRLRIATYNLGGMSAELYDIFVTWLHQQTVADIVVVTETHWGLGRSDGQWTVGSWHFLACADAQSRYAGLCVCVSARWADRDSITYSTWCPGRLLHVRISGCSVPIDVIAVYQWVLQDVKASSASRDRQAVWAQLTRLLGSLPVRNVLAVAGDFNTSCRQLGGHIGSGTLYNARTGDTEFTNLLQTHDLCVLNSWGRARPSRCATFQNGHVYSHIDYIIVRRSLADPQAKRAGPLALDLAPWRLGPRHRPVRASLPVVGSWKLHGRQPAKGPGYSLQELRTAACAGSANWSRFVAHVQATVQACASPPKVSALNRLILPLCARYFPPKRQAKRHAFRSNEVSGAIAEMWRAYHHMRSMPRHVNLKRRVFEAIRRLNRFRVLSRQVRRASLSYRKQRVHTLIDRAASAASKDQMTEVYRVCRQLAPKQRRERVCIRGDDGRTLSPSEQYDAIYGYFSQVFSHPNMPGFEVSCDPPALDHEELVRAIHSLKPRKAVPVTSLPVEVWQACSEIFADCVSVTYAADVATEPSALSSEITDCSLVLLPKPGKATKLPRDLRPLGIQDPTSKIIAGILRDRLVAQVGHVLAAYPQFAYCKGKSIDEGICRVAQFCKNVRSRLRAGAHSVRSRRSGANNSTCFGGIMVGIDLSRAFDTLDRPCLLRALAFANVPAPLQRLLLEIHNQCKYSVVHGHRQGSFSLQCGVRQGCAVSPMLFSLFTCWFLAELQQRTSRDWVAWFVTWFADDSHLGWDIQQPGDLEFVCRSLRATFGLLAECGMCANPLKSTVVLGLKGSFAKRWIREHTVHSDGKRCIQFGIPGKPLIIPAATSFQYLGTIISFSALELQTCRHRLQIAQMQRTRLLRFLHSRQLELRRRVTLYLACVRSTMLYGIHAIGISDAVLQKLEATDIKFLRGVARSPVHLTHENNNRLRKRLGVSSPTQALASLLRRRVQRSNDTSAVQCMQSTLDTLLRSDCPANSGSSLLVPSPSHHWFACPTCGQYFGSMRDLHTHQTKRHGPESKPQQGKLRARELIQHAVDGMPQCRHCLTQFTRVEALQKHLQGRCPVLFGKAAPATSCSAAGPTASPAEKGPAGSGETEGVSPCVPPLGDAAFTATVPTATAPVSTAVTPLYEDASFRQRLDERWRDVFTHYEDELMRTRVDTNFMLFVDVDGDHSVLPTLQTTAANWQEAFSAGRVTTSLRIVLFLGMMQQLQTQLQALLQNQDQLERLMAVGWLKPGATALTPIWNYYRWDAATQTQVVSDQQPLSHDSALQCVDVLLKTACNPLVLLRFKAAKELEDPTGDVIPFLVSVSLRGQQAQDCFTALQTLSHNGVLKLLGLRLRPERLRRGPMAEAVEEAYLATTWTDWKPRRNHRGGR